MRILAIDTALPAVSACVFDAEADELLASESVAMERGHGEALVPLIDRIVGKIEGGFASITRVATTVGPGSFTGIRIGLAAGQAVALARKIEIVGVSTLAALAAPHFAEGFEGVLASAIDARNGYVFVCAFDANGWTQIAACRMAATEAAQTLRNLAENGGLQLVGSGALLLERETRALGLRAKVLGVPAAPDIAYVARLGMIASPHDAPARPLYLKEADVTLPNGAKPPEA
jgi:tRNA threonylcarbamoyl adenosine modification protein YeaZ